MQIQTVGNMFRTSSSYAFVRKARDHDVFSRSVKRKKKWNGKTSSPLIPTECPFRSKYRNRSIKARNSIEGKEHPLVDSLVIVKLLCRDHPLYLFRIVVAGDTGLRRCCSREVAEQRDPGCIAWITRQRFAKVYGP